MKNETGVDLVGVGLNATDTIIPVPEYPEQGSKVAFRSANVLPGGQVASAVAACAMWGLKTRYVGKGGGDGAGGGAGGVGGGGGRDVGVEDSVCGEGGGRCGGEVASG